MYTDQLEDDIERLEARVKTLEAALNLIGTKCSTFRGPSTCVEDESRTRDGEYADERWCHQCIARHVLGVE